MQLQAFQPTSALLLYVNVSTVAITNFRWNHHEWRKIYDEKAQWSLLVANSNSSKSVHV